MTQKEQQKAIYKLIEGIRSKFDEVNDSYDFYVQDLLNGETDGNEVAQLTNAIWYLKKKCEAALLALDEMETVD